MQDLFTLNGKTALITGAASGIGAAIAEAQKDDIVLVAGKGHEDYQEIDGVKHPFSDVLKAKAALAEYVSK